MKRLIGLFLLSALVLGGCTDQERKAFEAKCDAPLRARVTALAESGQSDVLDVLGKTAGPIDDARRSKLTGAGAELGTVTGELFTARIPAAAIARVAAIDFVTSLQLAQIRDPQKP